MNIHPLTTDSHSVWKLKNLLDLKFKNYSTRLQKKDRWNSPLLSNYRAC